MRLNTVTSIYTKPCNVACNNLKPSFHLHWTFFFAFVQPCTLKFHVLHAPRCDHLSHATLTGMYTPYKRRTPIELFHLTLVPNFEMNPIQSKAVSHAFIFSLFPLMDSEGLARDLQRNLHHHVRFFQLHPWPLIKETEADGTCVDSTLITRNKQTLFASFRRGHHSCSLDLGTITASSLYCVFAL